MSSPSMQFAALADDTRCELVALLGQRPRPVHELAAAFPVSRPAISRHLRLLREAGIVTEERRGREHVYRLDRDRLKQLGHWLEGHWAERLQSLKMLAEHTVPTDNTEMQE